MGKCFPETSRWSQAGVDVSVEGDELRASANELRASLRDAEGLLEDGQPLLALQRMRQASALLPESVH